MSTQDFFTYSLRSNLSKNTNLGSDWKKTKKILWSTQTLKKIKLGPNTKSRAPNCNKHSTKYNDEILLCA